MGKRPLADIASDFRMQLGRLLNLLGLGRLEPQRGVDRSAALDTQSRLLDDPAVVLLRGLALGAPKRLRHFDQIMALGLRNQAGKSQQFTALLLSETRQVR